jgi:hypothetical protein
MLKLKDINKSDRWILTSIEVMKYNPIFRNKKGEYLKDEWTGFDIGDIIDGKTLTYIEYKRTEDKYIAAIKYLFEYYNCDRIQFIGERYFLEKDELHQILDKELETFYSILKNRRTLNLMETQLAARLVLRSALSGMFYCKGNKDIAVRFGYDFYMYFSVLEVNKQEIRNYIEKDIGLFTTR